LSIPERKHVTASPQLAAAAAGFAIGAGLIVAIGAQNAFVLRQGLRRDHTLAVVVTCIACDVTLITLGAFGFGSVVARFPAVTAIAAWGGAAYLAVHGALSLRSAIHPETLSGDGAAPSRALTTASAIGATLAVSLLNPHVYLDTVVLLGSIAAQYPAALRPWFAGGAACASVAWFSALGFGARLLAPLFGRPVAWRVLDVLIAGVMWWIAASLMLSQLRP
jgi:L-lysine exporter family protein LysE/ArgO